MRQHSLRWRLFLLVFAGTALLSGSTVTSVFRKSLPMQADKSVVVENRNGNIEVRASIRDSIRIRADIEVKARSEKEAKSVLENLNITVSQEGGDVLIGADYPRHAEGGDFWDWIFGRQVQVQIRYAIDVPPKAAVNAKTTNGNVAVAGVEGRISAHATNGRVKVEKGSNDVEAGVTNGSITVTLSTVKKDGRVSLHTTNGSVRLILPADAKAEIDASTVNGGISTDFPVNVEGKFVGKRIRGTINGGGGEIDLKAVNGSIHIEKE